MTFAAGVWGVGVEREVCPGCYAKLAAEIDGWTLWRFETTNGVYWNAGKPATGKAAIRPLGVEQALWGGVPRIHLHFLQGVRASIHGTHIHGVKVEIRPVGDRFTKPVTGMFDPRPLDGKPLEVFVESMPGPKSWMKLIKDRGVIDMTGLSAIVAARDQLAALS
jgi:hypothetical protein